MRIFTKRIMLLCIAVLFSFNLAKAEDWDCVVVNNKISPEKPYIELDMRWFEWYTSNSWMDSWNITFSNYNDEFNFTEGEDLCTGKSEWASSIRDDDDTYKTYSSTNFFVELWNPYTEFDDKYCYRVTIRILPKFPVDKDTRIIGTVSCKWRDNHEGPYDYSCDFSAKVDDNSVFQSLGDLTRDRYKVKYSNTNLSNISGVYQGYQRKLSLSVDGSTSNYIISDASTSYSQNVSVASNTKTYDVTQIIAIENNNYYLGESTHTVSFISKKTTTFKGSTYPNSVTTEIDKWNKYIKVKWTYTSTDLSTSGTWKIIRKKAGTSEETTVASGMNYGTSSYVDYDAYYDTKYTYTVVFMPSGWEDIVSPDLSVTSKEVIIKKDFEIALTCTSAEDNILLSWNHEALGGNGNYSYKVLRRLNDDTEWVKLKEENNLSANVMKYSYKDTDIGSSCDINHYKIEMIALNNETFHSNEVEARITGNTSVTSFYASKGDYAGNVKLSWNVNQVGADKTKFKLYRKLLGSESSGDWRVIYETEDVASVYNYDDFSANTGQYYNYKLTVLTSCDGEYDGGMNYYSDGFSFATGVISGRVTYGTGTAVEGVKVSLEKAVEDDNSNEQFYSLDINKVGGVLTSIETETAKTIFGNSFSVQSWVNLDVVYEGDKNIDEPVIAQVPYMFRFTAKKQDQDVFKLNLSTYNNTTKKYENHLTDIEIAANSFYHLTMAYDRNEKKVVITSVDEDRMMVTDSIMMNYAFDIEQSVVDLSKIDESLIEHFREFDGKNVIAFAACMEDSTAHYYKGYIDEIRVWSKFLSSKEISRNYDHLLAGSEKDLRIYYPLDEGIDNQKTAYDYSKTDGVSNSLHGIVVTGSGIKNYISPLMGLHSYTDENGNYTIRGIPFRGTGTNYNIIPALGVHEFSPNADNRFVSSSSLNFSGVNFSDVSSFPVSGVAYYKNTTYPVAGATLYVDGVMAVKDNKPVVTNANGEFLLSVPIGDHYVEIKRDAHTFENGGRYPEDPDNVGTKFTFDREVKDLTFYDNTTVMFAGRVSGGKIEQAKPLGCGISKANIGQAKITFSTPYKMNVIKDTESSGAVRYITNPDTLHYVSDSVKYVKSRAFAGNTDETVRSITILTDPVTGEFAVELPPVEYNVDSARILTNSEILFPELPTFIKASNELLDYCDTASVKVVYYEYDTIYKTTHINGVPVVDTVVEQEIETYYDERRFNYNASLFLIHRSEPVFEVTEHEDGIFGIDTAYCVEVDGTKTPVVVYTVDSTNNKVTYNYGHPIYESYGSYVYDIMAYEEYVNYDGEETQTSRVPLSGTIVKIENEFAAGNTISTQGSNDGQIVELAENEIELDSLGKAVYVFMGGAPNIIEPYTLNLNMSYEVNGRHYDWDKNGEFKAIILGSLPTGNNFVTSGPEQVQMILRDPPGSNSYSYWEAGSTHTNTTQLGGHYVGGAYIKFDIGNGFGKTFAAGAPGFYNVSSFSYVHEHVPGIDLKVNLDAHNRLTTSWTATEKVSTSSDVNFVGAEGDVFIGSSTNIIFGDAREVGFHHDKNTNEIVLNMEDCTTVGEEFTTGFKYTKYYIESTLIPNTIKLRNELLLPKGTTNITPKNDTIYYISNLETTNVNYGASNKDASVWGSDANVESVLEGSYTRIKGKSYDILYDHNYYTSMDDESAVIALPQDQVNFYNQSVYNWKNILRENERAKINAIDFGTAKNVSVDGGSIYESSYTVDTIDNVIGNFDFTIDLFVDHDFGIYAGASHSLKIQHGISFGGGGDFSMENSDENVDTKGYVIHDGNFTDAISVDIHEDNFGAIFRTRGGQTSCPYEDAIVSKYEQPGTILSESTMRVEMPSIRIVDNNIQNNVPSGSVAIFNVELRNESETDTDMWYSLRLVDESNPHGAAVAMDGLAITAVDRPVMIPANSVMNKQITIRQSDESITDYEDIKIVLSSECQNDPTSVYGAIADTLRLSAHFVPSCSPIEIHIDNRVLNVNSPNLIVKVDGYDLNYRSLKGINIQIKGEHDNNWTTLKSYVKNYDEVTQDVEFLDNSEIMYINPLTNLSDQNYLVRAVTLCEYGAETINNESEEILITKDLKSPALIANPNPADGILSAGDEISILFNENIKSGEITEVDNIFVKGILNESEVAHSVAYAALKDAEPARTEATINLNSRSFSLEMWMKYSSNGTIFRHGTYDNSLVADVDNDGYVNVSMNNTSVKSLVTIPEDKWMYLSFAVNQENDYASLSAVCAYDEFVLDLFVDEQIAPYTGNGTLTLGEDLNAAIHELTLWNYARSSNEALSEIYTTKSPYTTGLIGYWKLDEGHGTSGKDCVRNRHLFISGTNSWYLENDNDALVLDENNYVTMNVAHCPTNNDDNYLIEFWFKGDESNEAKSLTSMYSDAGSLNVRLNADGNIEIETSYGTYSNTYVNYLDGNWHHLALNVLKANSGSAILYIDGENVIQISAGEFPAVQTSQLIFGANYDGEYSQFFGGAFDEIRYWIGTYTADYIRNNMYSRVSANEPGLMAYYPMEKMSVDEYNQTVYESTLNDQSGNDTVENTALVVYEVTMTGATQISSEVLPQWTEMTPPLKVAPVYDNVDVSFVASERKILINIDEDKYKTEGCTLIFSVSEIRDENDNMMSPVTWSAYVSQNQLKWNESDINIRKQSGDEEYFSVKISNTSGNTEYWNIQNLPEWLETDIESGELAPLSEATINFTVSAATPIGRYESVVYLTGNYAIHEPLVVNLVCEGERPDWNVNPDEFLSSINIIAQLEIDGRVSEDTDDIVAVFAGNTCIGVASPTYNKNYDAYYLMMTVYIKTDSNVKGNADVRFKAYDASTGMLYPTLQVSDAIDFNAGSVIGDFNNPVIMSPADDIQQSINLAKGWSWISLNVEPNNDSVSVMTENIADDLLYIKSKSAFAYIDTNNLVWHGNLSIIDHSVMYKVKATDANVLEIIGKGIDPSENEIVINMKWNWIGYTPNSAMSVADALSNMNPVSGDMIKNRDEFALFDGYEWTGSLTSMRPGMGYIYMSNDPQTKTFTYPSVSKSDNVRNESSPVYPWAGEYQNNMNVIAIVKNGDDVVENAVIEVFAADAIRGMSEQSIVDDKHFLTIYGDTSADSLGFNVTVDGYVYETGNMLCFAEDAVFGSLENPYVIQIGDYESDGENVINVYPTLMRDILNISSSELINMVTIYDISGLKVYHSEEHYHSKQINVDFLNEGVYILKATTDDGSVIIRYVIKG